MWSVWQTWKMARRAAGFLGSLLILLLATAPAAAAPDFTILGDPLSNGGPATGPAVAITGSGKVYVVWKEGKDIYLRRSDQSGGSCSGSGPLKFAARQQLSNVPVDAFGNPTVLAENPAITTNDGDGVFAVWSELVQAGPEIGKRSIKVWRSLDGGENPGPVPSIQSLDFTGASPRFPAVAADSNHGVYVAAEGSVGGKTSVVVAQSLNDGATFDIEGNLSADRQESRRPSIAAAPDGSRVHVVWRVPGVWYKGFTPGPALDLNEVGRTFATPVTDASVNKPPKVAVYGSQVTAAWFQGTTLMARTAANANFSSVPDELVYGPAPSTTILSNLTLNAGADGRFFAWHEASGSTISLRYRLDGNAFVELQGSGISIETNFVTPTAGPSAGQGGSGRFVAIWRANGTPTTEIKLAHAGDFGSGDGIRADVRVTPPKVNLRTMDVPGQASLTVFIQLPDGTEIGEGSVRMNGEPPIRGSRVVGDHNGDGYRDVMVKFSRSVLRNDEEGRPLGPGTVPTGKYKVKGNMSGGCFFGEGTVNIVP